ncbi:MAG TPA: protein phosphatase 2C domain-containing protein [Bryobacteraceae bacterium]|nr:protein phosphatase 2C domain-containing protein [Bryobacteraceae bacterium]
MAKTLEWRSATASDPGRLRAENQDRAYASDELGIFLVVDGLGGHAAGEKAAETALEAIREEMALPPGDPRECVSRAITAANNRIFDAAAEDQNLRGMACVLTLAYIQADRVIVGHVGDSRLYLTWNGALRKITSDHSPVGEREAAGELTEAEAMAHPRRHEVFRDVGSRRREPDEEEFIELKEFLFKADAALLLCSDGLTDLLTSAELLEIIERYDGDPLAVTQDLIDAANLAGGTDNITAIFVAGSEFLGVASPQAAEARARNAVTKAREGSSEELALEPAPPVLSKAHPALTSRIAFLVYGFVLGTVLAIALEIALRWPKP